MTLPGSGIGANYDLDRLIELTKHCNKEVHLFRALCDAEYLSIINNHNKFIPYDFALEMKWFATCYKHAKLWGDLLYPSRDYKIIRITILEKTLDYLYYDIMLDNIGPAYAADIVLLNWIVKEVITL